MAANFKLAVRLPAAWMHSARNRVETAGKVAQQQAAGQSGLDARILLPHVARLRRRRYFGASSEQLLPSCWNGKMLHCPASQPS